MKRPRFVLIVQARMGASRLPGKPLKTVLNRPLLSYQLERLKRAKIVDKIVVATTTDEKDQPIVDLCQKENIPVFRGSEHDVLDRYYQAAKLYHADVVIRVTGDCPLSDPDIITRVVKYFFDHHGMYDYVGNTLQLTYPRGLDVEVFSFAALERAAQEAKRPEEREHVTVYLYEHPEQFRLHNIANDANESHHRWTVDTPEDFALISHIIGELYPQKRAFGTQEVLELLKAHPEWVALNAHIKQKKLREL